MAEDETLRRWGSNIEKFRKAHGWTPSGLGALLDPPVAQSTINRWENGRMEPRRHYKAQLASVFGTDVEILFPLTRSAA